MTTITGREHLEAIESGMWPGAVAVAFVVAGCSGPPMYELDALPSPPAPDALSCNPKLFSAPQCVAHGLAGIDVTGTWDYTRTVIVSTSIMTTTTVDSGRIALQQDVCGISGFEIALTFANDTLAGFYCQPYSGGYCARGGAQAELCLSSDGELHYHSYRYGTSMPGGSASAETDMIIRPRHTPPIPTIVY